jgi:hypothetical protein
MGEVTVLLHAAREGDSSAVGQDGEYGRDFTHQAMATTGFVSPSDFPGLGLTGTNTLVASANSTGLCGATNWRLPTYNELMTLAHYG